MPPPLPKIDPMKENTAMVSLRVQRGGGGPGRDAYQALMPLPYSSMSRRI